MLSFRFNHHVSVVTQRFADNPISELIIPEQMLSFNWHSGASTFSTHITYTSQEKQIIRRETKYPKLDNKKDYIQKFNINIASTGLFFQFVKQFICTIKIAKAFFWYLFLKI